MNKNLSLPCMAPSSKLVFRHEEWKQAGLINAKSNTCMTFPGDKDFSAGLWLLQVKIQPAGLKRHCGCTIFQRDLWFMATFTDIKIHLPYKPGPTKSQHSTASTLMARSTLRLTESILLEGHTSPWAWEPHSQQSEQQFPVIWRTLAHSPKRASPSLFRNLTMQLISRNRPHRWDVSAGNNKLK